MDPSFSLNTQGFYKVIVALETIVPLPDDMAFIPGGNFDMGDSFGEGDLDDLLVRSVYVSALYMEKIERLDNVTWRSESIAV